VLSEVDLARLRYYGSLTCIAIGLAILIYLGGRHIGDWVSFGGSDSTSIPLNKARPEDCPAGWRYLDNLEQRYTVCLPANLAYFDGAGMVSLDAASEADWTRAFSDFVFVNEAGWGLTPSDSPDPAVRPISLRVDVVPPGIAVNGCDLRSQEAASESIVSCEDDFFLTEEGPVFVPGGPIHRIHALVPTQADKSVNEVFSLYLSITSLREDWPLQQQLFRSILDSLQPY
jgi:hypothetical protein